MKPFVLAVALAAAAATPAAADRLPTSYCTMGYVYTPVPGHSLINVAGAVVVPPDAVLTCTVTLDPDDPGLPTETVSGTSANGVMTPDVKLVATGTSWTLTLCETYTDGDGTTPDCRSSRNTRPPV